jgi:hypothetical protein
LEREERVRAHCGELNTRTETLEALNLVLIEDK